MPKEQSSLARETYGAIMQWLETGHAPSPGSSRAMLKVELPDKRVFAFRRIDGMGGTAWAESIKDPRVRIAYDSNWNVLAKIEGLLAESDAKPA